MQGYIILFTLNNLKSVESDLNEMLERYLIGYLAEKIHRINYQDIVYIEGFSKRGLFKHTDMSVPMSL